MIKPWKLLQEEIAFKNKFVRIDKHLYEMPNGKTGEYFIRDGGGNVASILAFTSDKKFVLAREFRPGPKIVIDDLPGGMVDEGENHLEAAERELFEETGYKGDLILLTSTYLSAYSRFKKFCYVALNCEKISEVEGSREYENEFIEVVLKNGEEFLKQIKTGDLTDLETAVMGLAYLKKQGLIEFDLF